MLSVMDNNSYATISSMTHNSDAFTLPGNWENSIDFHFVKSLDVDVECIVLLLPFEHSESIYTFV